MIRRVGEGRLKQDENERGELKGVRFVSSCFEVSNLG